jgi:hypothetical protein
MPLGGAVEELVTAAPGETRAWLRQDISRLLCRVCVLAEVAEARVFFGVIRDDQCRKFHVDAVRLRLVTTYVGPGTEWVPSEAVDRDALARAIPHPAQANTAIVRDPREVRRASPGDVLALKGSRHPDAASGGAVHRSPPIEHDAGALRVALVLTVGGAASP